MCIILVVNDSIVVNHSIVVNDSIGGINSSEKMDNKPPNTFFKRWEVLIS